MTCSSIPNILIVIHANGSKFSKKVVVSIFSFSFDSDKPVMALLTGKESFILLSPPILYYRYEG